MKRPGLTGRHTYDTKLLRYAPSLGATAKITLPETDELAFKGALSPKTKATKKPVAGRYSRAE